MSTPGHLEEFERYCLQSVADLFALMRQIDEQIERVAVFLNRSQPIVNGKIGIAFSANQKLHSGLKVVDPWLVQLICLKRKIRTGDRKIWKQRRVSQAMLNKVGRKLEKLLPDRKTYQKSGFVVNPVFENKRQSVMACRLLMRLLEYRKEVKTTIGELNMSRSLLIRRSKKMLGGVPEQLAQLEAQLQIDFSMPDIAHKRISQKRMARL